MRAKPQFTRAGFLKSYLLPALIIFLIPGFGLWFFDHVEASFDSRIREEIISGMQADRQLTAAQREQAAQSLQKLSVSKVLASNKPEAKRMQDTFKSVQTRYAIFRWMKRIALVCLVAAAGAFVAVGVAVLFSFRSQSAQYWSLRLGWYVLRGLALIEVVGQGALAVALSFWVTAFWAERYYPKLIIVAALLALCAVVLLVKAIFRKLVIEAEFTGRLLKREAAPSLWQRVTQMTERLGIPPPDNIFVGIDDNFFVTEQPVKVDGQKHAGRTLFASLSLLKTLSRGEADAVLAHEMAHFSGEDTLYSRRISPLLGRYASYLEALYQGGLSRPVFYFMFLFWNLYQLSLNKLSRQREFRADRVGSELTSARDMAQALVKTASYSRYRYQVQATLFEKDENVEAMNVFERIEQGFPAFMGAAVNRSELARSGTPHPFDSHPPLAQRIEQLGLDAQSTLQSPSPVPALAESWFSAIEDAAAIEAEQWKAFEESFHQAHQESLAYRFKPEGDAEIRHVRKYFPEVEFRNSKGLTATLDYQKLFLSDGNCSIPFATISGCRLEESLGRKRLVIEHTPEGQTGKQKQKIAYEDFKREGGKFLEAFQHYYGRHMTAKQYLAQKGGASRL
jgi:Zn-dependent protease with chaperone function